MSKTESSSTTTRHHFEQAVLELILLTPSENPYISCQCPRGDSMRLLYMCLIVLFLCFCSPYTYADTIPGDGTIRVGRGSDPSASKSCSKTDFKIKLNGHGGGITNCINTSGADWTGLDIFAVIPSDQTVTCLSLLFTNCNVLLIKFLGNSNKKEVEIELFGGALI